jgi:2'-5' RNA ligase
MKIKKYIQFVKESTGYDYGCVMIEVPVSNWNEICSVIDKDDIYEEENDTSYGIQENPHLTLLYGLKSDVSKEKVEDILENIMYEWRNFGMEDFDYDDVSDRIAIEDASDKGIEIEIENIDTFENDNFDVVKFNIKKTELLQKLFDGLSELPNENTFPDYKPHMTIAYVKKGLGEKYKKKYRHKVSSNEICYSMANGEKVYFEI